MGASHANRSLTAPPQAVRARREMGRHGRFMRVARWVQNRVDAHAMSESAGLPRELPADSFHKEFTENHMIGLIGGDGQKIYPGGTAAFHKSLTEFVKPLQIQLSKPMRISKNFMSPFFQIANLSRMFERELFFFRSCNLKQNDFVSRDPI
jgi:hypothetical protein